MSELRVGIGVDAHGFSGAKPLVLGGIPFPGEAGLAGHSDGDVLTHAFRHFPNTPVDGHGKVKPAVLAARQRGVIFDIGHGMGSFSWKTARAMMALLRQSGFSFQRRRVATVPAALSAST